MRKVLFTLFMLCCVCAVQAQKKEGFKKGIHDYTDASGKVYSGEWLDRKPNGKGTMTFPNGSKYVGEWKDGLPNGQGTYTSPDGKEYVGEWKDGKENGQGTYTYADGSKYVGEFKYGFPNGQGTYTYADGTKYVGHVMKGKIDGQGTKTQPHGGSATGIWDGELRYGSCKNYRTDKEEITGEIVYGKINGQGTKTQPHGGSATGEWEDGKLLNGSYKNFRTDDVSEYTGEIVDGKLNGQGTFYIYSGNDKGHKYVGEFKDGLRNGQGTYTWPDGDKYVGEWKDGKRNGQGTLTWADGDKYVGEWKDDLRNGQGTLTQPDGGLATGEWKDDAFWNGSYKNYRTNDKAIRTGEQVNGNFLSGSCKFIVNGVAFNMIKVSGGTFQMGSTSGFIWEKPVHSVTLSDYFIGATEVTQELWQAVMGSNPSNFRGNNLPVEQVTWYDCKEFIQKLNGLTGQNFRLPTEAEWEFAAKGGTKSKGYTYSGSNTIGNVAWYLNNSSKKTHKVATKAPNELGIYDMTGNVDEWCQDWFDDSYYSYSPQVNPMGPDSSFSRAFRGGCWTSYAEECRTAYRGCNEPDFGSNYIGFRLAQ